MLQFIWDTFWAWQDAIFYWQHLLGGVVLAGAIVFGLLSWIFGGKNDAK